MIEGTAVRVVDDPELRCWRVLPICLFVAASVRANIAPLHFAYDRMQQTGADYLMLAKLRRNFLKEGVAVGYRHVLGGLHQPVEIVVRQPQSQLVEWGHGKAHRPPKAGQCSIRTLVQHLVNFIVPWEVGQLCFCRQAAGLPWADGQSRSKCRHLAHLGA